MVGKHWVTVALVVLVSGMATLGNTAEKAKFRKFTSIFEPSGVQQLSDGRFIVVQDESSHPFDLVNLQPDGEVLETPLFRRTLFSWASTNRALGTLEDLEGVASDSEDYIYAITSHSRKVNGKRSNAREQLVRFRLDGEETEDVQINYEIRKRIAKKHPSLKRAVKLRDVKEDGGFNIEALSFDPGKERLLIGLRAPLTESDEAIVIILENPKALFERSARPKISNELINLDLDGGGIRALAYDPHLGGYLVVSRRTDKAFKLWLWNGDGENSPRRVKIKGLKDLRQVEGISPVRSDDGQPRGILMVSDEGDGLTGKPARYLYVDYSRLKIK